MGRVGSCSDGCTANFAARTSFAARPTRVAEPQHARGAYCRCCRASICLVHRHSNGVHVGEARHAFEGVQADKVLVRRRARESISQTARVGDARTAFAAAPPTGSTAGSNAAATTMLLLAQPRSVGAERKEVVRVHGEGGGARLRSLAARGTLRARRAPQPFARALRAAAACPTSTSHFAAATTTATAAGATATAIHIYSTAHTAMPPPPQLTSFSLPHTSHHELARNQPRLCPCVRERAIRQQRMHNLRHAALVHAQRLERVVLNAQGWALRPLCAEDDVKL